MAKKITSFDAKNTKAFLKKFAVEYKKFAEALGLDVKQSARAIFNPTTGTVTVPVQFATRLVGKDGKVVGAPARIWNEHSETFGLKKNWLGRIVVSKGRNLTIVGLSMRKSAKPVMLESDDGSRFSASAETIITYLTKADAARAAKKEKDKPAKKVVTKKKVVKVADGPKGATLARGVKVELDKHYITKKGALIYLTKEKDGKVNLWTIRYSKPGQGSNTNFAVYGLYGKTTGEGANERRRFAEQQLRKLADGATGIRKSLPDNFEA